MTVLVANKARRGGVDAGERVVLDGTAASAATVGPAEALVVGTVAVGTVAVAAVRPLTVPRGVALYVGALFGPGLLMLPGLAAGIAGPASVLAWAGLLGVSALFAWVFTALGTRFPDGGGVIAYTAAGLGRRAGRAAGWCFLTGVVLGAPVVCLIGAGYVTALTGGGRQGTAAVAAVLLAAVTVLTTAGARAGTTVQMVLVALLLTVIVTAVVGSAPSARAANFVPFAPHGWAAVGSAASVLMLSFIGWEAAAPLTRRLADPARDLPRITVVAFGVTAVVYSALAVVVVAVLGAGGAGVVPVGALLRVVVGSAGPVIAAGAAVVLTLAAVNSYLTGAAALAAHVRRMGEVEPDSGAGSEASDSRGGALFGWIALAGLVELGGEALGVLDATRMITLTTSLFLVVYVASTASAARVLRGRARCAAVAACAASLVVLGFAGVSAVPALAVGLGAMVVQRSRRV